MSDGFILIEYDTGCITVSAEIAWKYYLYGIRVEAATPLFDPTAPNKAFERTPRKARGASQLQRSASCASTSNMSIAGMQAILDNALAAYAAQGLVVRDASSAFALE
jgi:hypothetical protein